MISTIFHEHVMQSKKEINVLKKKNFIFASTKTFPLEPIIKLLLNSSFKCAILIASQHHLKLFIITSTKQHDLFKFFVPSGDGCSAWRCSTIGVGARLLASK